VAGIDVIVGWGGLRLSSELQELLAASGRSSIRELAPPQKLVALAVESGAAAVVLTGRPSGAVLRAVADAADRRPDLATLVVGPVQPAIDVLVALASGVTGYLRATTQAPAVADAVRAILEGEMVLPREVSLPLVRHLRAGGRSISVSLDGRDVELTTREWGVLVLLRQSYVTAEIARRLMISKATVRTHIAALVRKVGVSDRSMLTRMARDAAALGGTRVASD
jgi:DNA-binding NarL/FixJ family response regulator